MFFLVQVVLLIAVLLTSIFYLYTKLVVYKYWKRRGVKQLDPVFPLGDLHPILKNGIPFPRLFEEMYLKVKSNPFTGFYSFTRPCLLVTNTALIKNILTRDASYFPDHGTHCDEKRDPLSGGLFQLEGDRWRQTRMKLTPAFTSGKLKGMFQIMLDRGNNLKKYIEVKVNENVEVEMKDLMARYTTDIIAAVAFGNDIDSIKNPDQIFREKGRKVFDLSLKNAIRFTGFLVAPKLISLLRMKFVDQDVEDFFMTLVSTNFEYREKNNIFRKDFLQLLMQLRNTGSIKLNDDWTADSSNIKTMPMGEVAAHAFQFYSAGFETSSTTMSFCLYELAKNKNVQAKAQKEIDQVLNRYDGILTYDAVQELPYLEHCIDETLRKYPVLPILQRTAVQKYKMPGSDLNVDPGTLLIFPIIGIHRDPELYPDPLKFIPERFTDPKYYDTLKTAYFPFGDGPRTCIGLRMGKLMMKIGLSTILSKYNFELGSGFNEEKELEFHKKSVILAPERGIDLKIKLRESFYFIRRRSDIA